MNHIINFYEERSLAVAYERTHVDCNESALASVLSQGMDEGTPHKPKSVHLSLVTVVSMQKAFTFSVQTSVATYHVASLENSK